VLIGSPGFDAAANGTADGAAYVFDQDAAGTWRQTTALTQSGSLELGTAVSLRGAIAVVTAPGTSRSGATRVGAVYIYELMDTTWTRRATLFHPTGAASSELGSSVAHFGDQILIGARGTNDGGHANGGAVFLAQRKSATSYVLNTAFAAPPPTAVDHFGATIGVTNDAIFVGAPRKFVSNVLVHGAVYVYTTR
jgi:hypothetical protein